MTEHCSGSAASRALPGSCCIKGLQLLRTGGQLAGVSISRETAALARDALK